MDCERVSVMTSYFIWSIGMSLSVLKVDDLILNSLDSTTKAPAWPVGVSGTIPKLVLDLSTSWGHERRSRATPIYDWF